LPARGAGDRGLPGDQDPRERPSDKRDEPTAACRFFSDEAMTAALTGERNGQAPARFTPHTGRHGRAAAREAASSPNPQPLRHTPHTSKTARAQGLRGQTSAPQQATAVTPAATSWPTCGLQYLKVKRRELSRNQFRRLCRDEYLNYLRVREWQDLHTQLKLVCRDLGNAPQRRSRRDTGDPDRGAVRADQPHRSTTCRHPKRDPKARRGRPITEFMGTRGSRFAIQPGRRWPRIHRRW
jgi:ATP-dependent helicase HrpA